MSSHVIPKQLSIQDFVSELQLRETAYPLRQEMILWGALPFLLFTGLVTLEWVLRKFANLS